MADGSGPTGRRGRRSHIADQCQMAMNKEIEATRMKPEGFVLLKASDLAARVKAQLTPRRCRKRPSRDDEQIRRWQVEKIKALGL